MSVKNECPNCGYDWSNSEKFCKYCGSANPHFVEPKKDIFSLPEKAQLLFDACPTEKVVKWFEEGKHSHVRFSNQKEYDQTIIDFVK